MPLPFLNPWMLLTVASVGIPVLIHLWNRRRVKTVEWAAMELLRRVMQVKSRQVRLQDVLLMLLRCLAVLLIALAMARPTTHIPIKSPDVAAVIALDVSYSMEQRPGAASRLDDAVGRVRQLLDTIGSGRPVTLVLMGETPRVLLRNVGNDRARIEPLLRSVQALPEGLNLERCLAELKPLVSELKAPSREVFLVTDAQGATWGHLSESARDLLSDLTHEGRVCLVSAGASSQENLAITRFEFAGDNLRLGGMARYAVDVCNQGAQARNVGAVELLAGDTPVDRQVIGKIAPGQIVSVPLYAPLTREGPLRLTARIAPDELGLDNTRYASAEVRHSLRVLCVDGNVPDQTHDRPTDFLLAALTAEGTDRTDPSLEIKVATWMGLGAIRPSDYDVVILADVPDVSEEKAAGLYEFVDRGGGLILFMGDNVSPTLINNHLRYNAEPLLPATLMERLDNTSKHPDGVPLDPALPDHPLLGVLRSIPTDLLTDCRFARLMRVQPNPGAGTLLKLAGDGAPVLLERRLGRGKVLLFTSGADRRWNNMCINPVYPLLLRRAMIYLTSQASERALLVNQPIILPVAGDLTGAKVKLTDPAGKVHDLTTTVRDGEVLVEVPDTPQPGFYAIATAPDAPPMVVAVNVDPAESEVRALSDAELAAAFKGTGVQTIGAAQDLAAGVTNMRTGRELWYYLVLGALVVMLVEGYVARRIGQRSRERDQAQGLRGLRGAAVVETPVGGTAG